MSDSRLEFYDPLYETIIFEKGLPTKKGFLLEDAYSPIDPRDLVKCAEFARLAFLRQVGLAWLVFPSATHTRFAHSIGCYWLGKYAETLIKVKYGNKNNQQESFSLGHWLNMINLREEFYLSLLFHDIGHGPLSHVLENNIDFINALYSAGVQKTEHEFRGAMLLEGKGPLADAWREIAYVRYGDEQSVKTFRDIKWIEFIETISIPAICYLMTGGEEYLIDFNFEQKKNLRILKELVSGVLDLDRMDHYARDSYFSGLKQVSINIRGFLSNLRITINSSLNSEDPLLSLTDHGASYAASLLFSKKQILSTMFRNSQSISYHAMVNWALSSFLTNLTLNDRGLFSLRIALMEDDQFLDLLSNSSHFGCKYIIKRIRSLQPYYLVNKWGLNQIKENPHIDFLELKNQIKTYQDKKSLNSIPEVLFYFDNGEKFWTNNHFVESQDWLDTERLRMDENPNMYLKDNPEYKNDFESLRNSGKEKFMWVFSKDQKNIKIIKDEINKILNTIE